MPRLWTWGFLLALLATPLLAAPSTSGKTGSSKSAAQQSKRKSSPKSKLSKNPDKPHIDKVNTDSGTHKVAPGENIVLIGRNIGPHPGTVTVLFGQRQVTGELIWNDLVSVDVPTFLKPGTTVKVAVATAKGKSNRVKLKIVAG